MASPTWEVVGKSSKKNKSQQGHNLTKSQKKALVENMPKLESARKCPIHGSGVVWPVVSPDPKILFLVTDTFQRLPPVKVCVLVLLMHPALFTVTTLKKVGSDSGVSKTICSVTNEGNSHLESNSSCHHNPHTGCAHSSQCKPVYSSSLKVPYLGEQANLVSPPS